MKNLKIKVPVSWGMRGFIEVEAKTLAEAAEVARSDMAKEGLGLPEGTFINGSYEVDDEAMDVFQSDAVNEQAFSQEELLNMESTLDTVMNEMYDQLPASVAKKLYDGVTAVSDHLMENTPVSVGGRKEG